MTVLAGYVGFQYSQNERALEVSEAPGLADAKVTVQPRPVTPFNWTVFVSDDEKHRFAHVNLKRKEPRRYRPGDGFIARVDSPYLPLEQAIWVTRRRYGETDQHLARPGTRSRSPFRWFCTAGVRRGQRTLRLVRRPALPHPGREGCRFATRLPRRRRVAAAAALAFLGLRRKRSASCGWLE